MEQPITAVYDANILYPAPLRDLFIRLAQAGLTLHPLATWTDILRSPAAGAVTPQDRTEIERFLADPVAWSTRHGGRAKLSVRS